MRLHWAWLVGWVCMCACVDSKLNLSRLGRLGRLERERLVLKLLKMKLKDRLQHRPKSEESDLMGDDSTEKILRGKTATAGGKIAGLDIAALTKASNGAGSTSYKEDTKLEDRLAMEAEEEKKFSNGDTYDYGEGESNNAVDKSSGVGTAQSSLSPKEQATQEMQSYNALISTESNRELSQIQDEITKATQSSMGQVSVVGQKQNVNTEAPQLPGIPGLPGLPGIGGTGGGGGEDPLAAALGASNGAAPIEIGGGSSTGAGASLASSLQGAEGAETGAALGSEISNQQQTSMQDTGSSQGGNQISAAQIQALSGSTGSQQSGGMSEAAAALGGDQKPIEIGADQQQPVEMGMIGAGAQPGQQDQSSASMLGGGGQESSQFMSALSQGGGGGSVMELGGQGGMQSGGMQQQTMSFKKSHISRKYNRKQPKTEKRSKTRSNSRLRKSHISRAT